MSEIGQDASKVIDQVGDLLGDAGRAADDLYVAVKSSDWGWLGTLVGLSFAVVVIGKIIAAIVEANKVAPPDARSKSRPPAGTPEYLDWANRRGKYADLP